MWDRIEGKDVAQESTVGLIPKEGTIDLAGLEGEISEQEMEELMSVPKEYWLEQLDDLEGYYKGQFGADLPEPIWKQFNEFKTKLQESWM